MSSAPAAEALNDELRSIAIDTLRAVCRDDGAPAAARAAASRTLLEVLGFIGKNSTGDGLEQKSLGEMSLPDLDREIARLQRK